MNEIIRHIEYLLVANDCVVIPGLGAVIAHTLPARYDSSRHTFIPPSRVFSFNASLDHNDGLLVSSVARSKSITFEAARAMVAGEVESMKRLIASVGSISFGLVGCLKMAADGSISFEPGKSSALSPMTMWLPQLQLRPVTELARLRAQQAEAASRPSPHRVSPVNYIYRAVRVAASFAILLALGFVLGTTIDFDKAQYASLGIENFTAKQPVESERVASVSSVYRRPGQSTSEVKLYLRPFDDASEIVDTASRAAYQRERLVERMKSETSPTEAVMPEKLRFESQDRYYLVVASLPTETDAEDFVSQYKNQQLGILAKDGRYRVYAATGANLREARTAAVALAERYPDVWVCRK
ncbi:MAG: SPOR domain-containing protein [Muribaculaceae bacterium]|nr:SPOR domain-containing protein [Muribaculaceae bacterium]